MCLVDGQRAFQRLACGADSAGPIDARAVYVALVRRSVLRVANGAVQPAEARPMRPCARLVGRSDAWCACRSATSATDKSASGPTASQRAAGEGVRVRVWRVGVGGRLCAGMLERACVSGRVGIRLRARMVLPRITVHVPARHGTGSP